jgi:hypothetical protein
VTKNTRVARASKAPLLVMQGVPFWLSVQVQVAVLCWSSVAPDVHVIPALEL